MKWFSRAVLALGFALLSLSPAWSITVDEALQGLQAPTAAVRLQTLKRLQGSNLTGFTLVDAVGKLVQDSDLKVRLQAVTLLAAQYADAGMAREYFRQALDDKDIAVVRVAITALGKDDFPDMQTGERLCKIAGDPHSPLRGAATVALVKMWQEWCMTIPDPQPDPQRVPKLIRTALQDPDVAVRRAVVHAVTDIAMFNDNPAKVLGLLGPSVKDADPEVRMTALDGVRYSTDPHAVDLLVTGVRDTDEKVVEKAWNCLSEYRMIRSGNTFYPAFVQALRPLLTDPAASLRINAVALLDENTDPAIAPLILPLITDTIPEIRAEVAKGLGPLGDLHAVTPLIKALRDPDADVRANAALSLGQLKDLKALAPLLDAAKDEEWTVRQHVATALGELGDAKAVDALLILAKDSSSDARGAALAALGHFLSDPRAVGPVIAGLHDARPEIRTTAIEALAGTTVPYAVDALLATTQDKNVEVRAYATKALCMAKNDPRVGERMLAMLQTEKDEGVIESVAFTLALIRDPRAAKAMMLAFGRYAPKQGRATSMTINLPGKQPAAMPNTSGVVSHELASAVNNYGEVMVQTVLAGLADADPTTRGAALSCLLVCPDARAVPLLLPLLKDPDETIRCQAVMNLGLLQDARSIDGLIAAVKDPSPNVQQEAIYALTQIGDLRALSTVLAQHDLGNEVQRAVAMQLATIADPGVIEVLAHRLEAGDDRYEFRKVLLDKLLQLDSPAAIDTLVAYLKRETKNGSSCPFQLTPTSAPALLDRLLTLTHDTSPAIRVSALCALAPVTADPRVNEALTNATNDPDTNVKTSAQSLLKERSQDKVAEKLQQLHNTSGMPRWSVLHDLRVLLVGENPQPSLLSTTNEEWMLYPQHMLSVTPAKLLIDPKPLIDPLLALCKDKDANTRQTAIELLALTGDPRVADIAFTLLDDPEENVTNTAMRILAQRHDPRLFDRLVPLLEKPQGDMNGEEVCPAARMLGILKDPRAVEPLLAHMRQVEKKNAEWGRGLMHAHSSPDAIRALGAIGDVRAVEPLIALVDDDRPMPFADVLAAVIALGALHDARATMPLLRQLDRFYLAEAEVHMATEHYQVFPQRQLVITALGKIGDRQAVEPLMAMLGRGTMQERAAAAWALGQLGDPRAVASLTAELPNFTGTARAAARDALAKLGKVAP